MINILRSCLNFIHMARKGGKNLQLSGKRPRPEGAAASLSSRPEDAGSPDRGCRGFGWVQVKL